MKTSISYNKTPIENIEIYIELLNQQKTAVNKKRKEIDRKLTQITQEFKTIEDDKISYLNYKQKCDEFQRLHDEMDTVSKYTDTKVNVILDLLESKNFIDRTSQAITLTAKGMVASHIREIHCLLFANLFHNDAFNELSSVQMVGLFSCFTNISVAEEFTRLLPPSGDKKLERLIIEVQKGYDYYQQQEFECQINTGFDYYMHYDLVEYVINWCKCDNIEDCKLFLQNIANEKEIFLGEFVKALLKINNISNEMEKIAELLGNIELLSKLREIPNMTLKFVVTNQSLYV